MAILAARRVLTEERADDARTPDLIGASVLAAALGLMSLGLVKGTTLLVSVLAAGGAHLLGPHRTGWYVAAAFALGAGLVALLLPARATPPR